MAIDIKISALVSKSSLASTDIIPVVDTATQKMSISNLIKNLGPNALLTPPVDAQFSWVNQGGASISTGDYGILLTAPANGAGVLNWRLREKAAPTTPYSIIAGFTFIGTCNDTTETVAMALGFRNNAAGTLAVNSIQSSLTNNPLLLGSKWTSVSALSANYVVRRIIFYAPILWLRIRDDGVNRICSFSSDGVNFFDYHTVGRTDFLTADRVFWGVDNSCASQNFGLTLVSWKETS